MSINLFDSKGVSLDKQRMTWKDMVQPIISKLDDEAFTRVRIILTNPWKRSLTPSWSITPAGTCWSNWPMKWDLTIW